MTDLDRSIRFYEATAGLLEAGRWEPEGMVEVSMRAPGDDRAGGLMLMWRHGQVGGPPPGGEVGAERAAADARNAAGLPQTGYSRLILVVDEIDDICDRIRTAGGKAGKARHSEELGVRIAFAKDPDGYMLELIEGGLAGL